MMFTHPSVVFVLDFDLSRLRRLYHNGPALKIDQRKARELELLAKFDENRRAENSEEWACMLNPTPGGRREGTL